MTAVHVAAVLEYDGTEFAGWQFQPFQRTVEGEFRRALAEYSSAEPQLHASGRTDTGVHARSQWVDFQFEGSVPVENLADALNTQLPVDLAVRGAWMAGNGFHARHSAISRTYGYRVVQARQRRPLLRDRAWVVEPGLDLSALRDALAIFHGSHDFTAFCSADAAGDSRTRNIRAITLVELSDGFEIRITADGFLRRMVRGLVGAAVEAGRNRVTISELQAILEQGRRADAPPPAPAQGLTLAEVLYPAEYHFATDSSVRATKELEPV